MRWRTSETGRADPLLTPCCTRRPLRRLENHSKEPGDFIRYTLQEYPALAQIILSGLEWRTEQDLARVLTGQGHQIALGWEGALASADALFCSADNPGYPALLGEVRTLRPDLPVIAVTGLPEQAKWLDALEAGAADYCCAPFETAQLACLLAGVLGHALGRQPNQDSAAASKSHLLL
jgi:CheY-like chemotaxis protein